MRGANRRWPLWLMCAGLTLCVIPLLAGAWGAFPAADDFVYATRTYRSWADTRSLPHVLATAWRYSEQIYRTWQGTFVGALVMALNPAVVTIAGYGAHVWVLLAAFLGAMWAMVRAVGRRIGLEKPASAVAFCVLAALSWLYAPDLLEGVYWFNSAWFYTMAHAAWMLAVALALRLPEARGRKRRWMCALLWTICGLLGLDNYITAMLALCSLALLGLLALPRRRDALPLLTAAALLAVALAVSVLAPGNAVRMATETQFPRPEPWLPRAILLSAEGAARFWWRFLTRTPLAALCLLAAPWFFDALRHSPLTFRFPLPVALCAFLGLCAMIFPHMYAAGYTGPGRIVNLYFFYCVLAAPFCAAYAMGALVRRRGSNPTLPKAVKPVRLGLAAVLLAAALLSNPPLSYLSLVGDLANGRIAAYRQDMLTRFEALAAAEPGSDAVVAPLAYAPPSVGYVPFMGDPAHWANEALAARYGLHSVRMGTAP